MPRDVKIEMRLRCECGHVWTYMDAGFVIEMPARSGSTPWIVCPSCKGEMRMQST